MHDFLGPTQFQSIWMLHAHNIRRLLLATVMLLIAAADGAFAQQVDDAQRPSIDEVQVAFGKMRAWLDAFETPRMDDAASQVPLSHASGVSIVLRRSGRVVGMGSDSTGDALMLRRAAGKAMNSVLGDPAISALLAEVRRKHVQSPENALPSEAIEAELGRKLTIELEVAGPLTPLVGRNTEQLVAKLQPGLDGVAVRQDNTIRHTFQSQLRATNSTAAGEPAKLLMHVAMQTGIEFKNIENLASQANLSLYRFRSVTLAESQPGQPPRQTIMGDVKVPQEQVTRETMEVFARGLARHIAQRMWPDPVADPETKRPIARPALGLRGDYSVVSDQYKPLLAPPTDQALAAFALATYANVAGDANAKRAAEMIMQDLAQIEESEEDPLETDAGCAAFVLAIVEMPSLRRDAKIEAKFIAAVDQLDAALVDPAKDDLNAAHVKAMIAAALARLLTYGEKPAQSPSTEEVRAAIDAAWNSVPPQLHVSLLPWIGWAERDWAASQKRELPLRESLQVMKKVLSESRIGSPRWPVTADTQLMEGGYVLVSAVGRAENATATVQSVRPAAWLVDDEPADLPLMRFLIQLSVRPDHVGTFRNFDRALGGVRNAIWDSNQPLPAQSLALITAAKTLAKLPPS